MRLVHNKNFRFKFRNFIQTTLFCETSLYDLATASSVSDMWGLPTFSWGSAIDFMQKRRIAAFQLGVLRFQFLDVIDSAL